jgi:hypothetical protein
MNINPRLQPWGCDDAAPETVLTVFIPLLQQLATVPLYDVPLSQTVAVPDTQFPAQVVEADDGQAVVFK